MRSLYYMERMTYPQIKWLAVRTDLALLPVGPPEAHGLHLPIGTAHTAARELCDRAAHELEAEGAECLIAPLLPYCLAEGARPFPGTVSVRAEIVAALVADICRGLAASGFEVAGQPRGLLSASTRPSGSSLQKRERRYFGPEISSQHR